MEVVASCSETEDSVRTEQRYNCQGAGCEYILPLLLWPKKEQSLIIVLAIAIVAKEKGVELDRRPKKNMYIKDVTEFARVLLTTTEMKFNCS